MQAVAAALALLRKRARAPLRGSPDVAERELQRRMTRAYLDVRGAASRVALGRTLEELAVYLPDGYERIIRPEADVMEELARARRAAGGYSTRWRRSVDDALEAGQSSLPRIYRQAAQQSVTTLWTGGKTETSQAFSSSRTRVLQGARAEELFKIWDSVLDQQRTCRICSRAHGTVVRVNESFPQGMPGGVHPNCLCSIQIVPEWLVDDEVMDAMRQRDAFIASKAPLPVPTVKATAFEPRVLVPTIPTIAPVIPIGRAASRVAVPAPKPAARPARRIGRAKRAREASSARMAKRADEKALAERAETARKQKEAAKAAAKSKREASQARREAAAKKRGEKASRRAAEEKAKAKAKREAAKAQKAEAKAEARRLADEASAKAAKAEKAKAEAEARIAAAEKAKAARAAAAKVKAEKAKLARDAAAEKSRVAAEKAMAKAQAAAAKAAAAAKKAEKVKAAKPKAAKAPIKPAAQTTGNIDDAASSRVLDAEQQKAVKDFTGNSYGVIRQAQANPDRARRLGADAAIEKGKALEKAIAGNVQYQGELYRGILVEPAVAQQLAAAKEVSWMGQLSSSSVSRKVATENFATPYHPGIGQGVVFRIHNGRGMPVHDLGMASEKEVLMSGASRFKVLSSSVDGKGRMLIELEQL